MIRLLGKWLSHAVVDTSPILSHLAGAMLQGGGATAFPAQDSGKLTGEHLSDFGKVTAILHCMHGPVISNTTLLVGCANCVQSQLCHLTSSQLCNCATRNG